MDKALLRAYLAFLSEQFLEGNIKGYVVDESLLEPTTHVFITPKTPIEVLSAESSDQSFSEWCDAQVKIRPEDV